ncbi:unnamed protein product, partial [Closterium sp. Yama58-4]
NGPRSGGGIGGAAASTGPCRGIPGRLAIGTARGERNGLGAWVWDRGRAGLHVGLCSRVGASHPISPLQTILPQGNQSRAAAAAAHFRLPRYQPR